MKLVLFDIDGTLITSRGAGRRAMRIAFERVFGTAGGIDHYDLRGRTDTRILHDVMAAEGRWAGSPPRSATAATWSRCPASRPWWTTSTGRPPWRWAWSPGTSRRAPGSSCSPPASGRVSGWGPRLL